MTPAQMARDAERRLRGVKIDFGQQGLHAWFCSAVEQAIRTYAPDGTTSAIVETSSLLDTNHVKVDVRCLSEDFDSSLNLEFSVPTTFAAANFGDGPPVEFVRCRVSKTERGWPSYIP